MKVVQTTAILATQLRAIVDQALGLPKIGSHVGGGIHAPMPATWDGTGQCPPGWTRTESLIYQATALDALVVLEDATLVAVQTSGLITSPQQTTVANAAATRVDLSDLNTGRTAS